MITQSYSTYFFWSSKLFVKIEEMGTKTIDVTHIQELHEQISKLCKNLEDIGCESLVITVTKNGYCQLGSKEGRKYLEEKFEVIMDFIRHCQENRPPESDDDDDQVPDIEESETEIKAIVEPEESIEDKKEVISNIDGVPTETDSQESGVTPSQYSSTETEGTQSTELEGSQSTQEIDESQVTEGVEDSQVIQELDDSQVTEEVDDSQASEDLLQIEVSGMLDGEDGDSEDDQAELMHYQLMEGEEDVEDRDEDAEEADQDMEDSLQQGNVVIIKVDDLKDVQTRGRGTPKNTPKRKSTGKKRGSPPTTTYVVTNKETGMVERRFICEYCDAQYRRHEDLQVHMRKHTGETPFSCVTCGKSFRSRQLLRSHSHTHSDTKMFQCDICFKTFSRSSGLYRHKMTHSAKAPYKCDICNKEFTDPSNFKSHKLKHTGQKPYQCGECSMRFWDRGGLVNHHRVHTGEKPFACAQCGDRFRRRKNLVVHMKKHAGVLPEITKVEQS